MTEIQDRPVSISNASNKDVTEIYREIYQLVRPLVRDSSGISIKKVFLIAIKYYRERKLTPVHASCSWPSIDIAYIVGHDMGLGEVPVICALLQDWEPEIITPYVERVLGPEVAKMLYKLASFEDALRHQDTEKDTQDTEDWVITCMHDPNVVLIKLAENLQKMRSIELLGREQRVATISQAKYVYVPVAHRLGYNTIKAELEDLHLKYTQASVYNAMQKQIKSSREERERFTRRFKHSIQTLLQQTDIPFIITERTKSMTSMRNKMKTLDLFFRQVYDIFAIRIILDVPRSEEKQACWKAYEAITNCYKPHPHKFRNWLSYPRSNGYQALQVTVMSHERVWVEVQIRTQKMNSVAEQGLAAHWRYKVYDNIVDKIPLCITESKKTRSGNSQRM